MQLEQTVHAVAGIGNPERFFQSLAEQGFDVIAHAFPDHHWYQPSDIVFSDNLPVIMTEKDAVKCQQFAGSQHYYQKINPLISDSFIDKLMLSIK